MTSDGFPYPANEPGNFAAEQPTDEPLLEFGYAPGSYDMKCRACKGIVHDVDKRAMRCRGSLLIWDRTTDAMISEARAAAVHDRRVRAAIGKIEKMTPDRVTTEAVTLLEAAIAACPAEPA